MIRGLLEVRTTQCAVLLASNPYCARMFWSMASTTDGRRLRCASVSVLEIPGTGRASGAEMDMKRKEQIAYEYLCRLEEAKQ